MFMAVGVKNNMTLSLGYLVTQIATSYILFPLLWQVVADVEQQCLKVLLEGTRMLSDVC